jgi:hypothetical protein
MHRYDEITLKIEEAKGKLTGDALTKELEELQLEQNKIKRRTLVSSINRVMETHSPISSIIECHHSINM